jgi:hypothetical protein
MKTKGKNSDEGLREEYNLDELEIAAAGKGWTRETAWAVCVSRENKELIPLKLYKVEFYPQLSKARVLDKNGEAAFYPQEWFLPVKFAENVKNVLEKVA